MHLAVKEFFLNATLKYHIESFKDIDLPYVEKFLKSIYVDDITLRADYEEELYELYEKSKRRLAEGGFNLRKVISRIDRHECDLTQRVDLQNSEGDQSYTKAELVGDVQCECRRLWGYYGILLVTVLSSTLVISISWPWECSPQSAVL